MKKNNLEKDMNVVDISRHPHVQKYSIRSKETEYSKINIKLKTDLKERIVNLLKEMDLTLPQAIEFFLEYLDRKSCFPTEMEIPNKKTINAMQSLKNKNNRKFDSVAEFMSYLNEEN